MELQKDKFINLTVDDKTQIILRQQTLFNGFDVMMESWIWDGIHGQSVIFAKQDVENVKDDDLTKMIKEHYKTEKVTISMQPDFIFLNFKFLTTE